MQVLRKAAYIYIRTNPSTSLETMVSLKSFHFSSFESIPLLQYRYIMTLSFPLITSPPFLPLPSPNSCVNVHPLRRLLALGKFVHCDVLADILLLDDLLVKDGSRAAGEAVVALLLLALVRLDVVAHEGGLVFGDDGDVDVATRAQVVEDTSQDGVRAQLDSVVAGQRWLPRCLEDGHGGQRAGTHGHVGQLVGGSVGVDGEEVSAGRVDAGDDEVGANVALVAEEVLLQHRHARHDARLAACRQGV